MRPARFLIALVFGLLFAVAALAQTPAPPDYDAFERDATRAEQLLESPSPTESSLVDVRTALADWRVQFLAAQETNSARIETLRTQVEALGPPPEEGAEAEPAEISRRREELRRDLADAQVPQVTATEAFNRTTGLISEIDATLRARQNEAILEHGPLPLNPANWSDALSGLWNIAAAVDREAQTGVSTPERRAELRDSAPTTIAMLALGVFLLVRGRPLAARLISVIRRRRRTRGRATLAFLVSLGQVALPVIGAILVLTSIIASNLAGTTGSAVLSGLVSFLAATFTALWLAGRLFPPDPADTAAFNVGPEFRARARRATIGIGMMSGLGLVLEVLTDLPQMNAPGRAVILFPFFVGLGFFMWRLSRALLLARAAAVAEAEAQSTDDPPGHTFGERFAGGLAFALRIVVVGGILLAATGYANAAQALMGPAAMSLAVLGVFIALQVPIRDLYALATSTPLDEAADALVPVLINFLLAFAALPVLALIWGMRTTELGEIYARFNEGFALGEGRITPGDALSVILVFAIVLLATRLFQGALKSTVLPRTKMDPGARNAVVSGIGYVGVAIAALLAINAGGIDLTALAFILSALSVGIGFGLQNVVQNFISGIILLVERPIGEGDWIEVGGNMGIVKDISVRSTTIETFDKQQVIVPNGDFITGTVTNWTRGNQLGRAIVTVGVAYGTDTRKVQQILLEIAKSHPDVMKFPEPGVDFLGFGADSLDFRIRAMLYDVTTGLAVKTEMHHQIAERFVAEGIEIPFAQRDIWLRNPEALPGQPSGAAAAMAKARQEEDSVEDALKRGSDDEDDRPDETDGDQGR